MKARMKNPAIQALITPIYQSGISPELLTSGDDYFQIDTGKDWELKR